MKVKIKLLITLLSFCIVTQAQTGSFLHNGVLRNYNLHIPAIYNGSISVPLVFNLHGYTSDASQQEFYTVFNPIADTANFIICYPNGISNSWNAGQIFPSTADDIGFISALIDTISSNYNIDPQRVYSTGMSNGGFMSYELAYQLNNRIAAIASVTGSMTPSQMQSSIGSLEIPVMQIHGTADPTVLYNGASWTISIDSLINFWKDHNNCSDSVEITPLPDIDNSDGTTTTTYHYKFCDQNTEVLFYKVQNGEHTWPGASIDIGVTSHDYSASGEIWKFFYRHTLHPNFSYVQDQAKKKNIVLIYPNPTSDIINIECNYEITKLTIYTSVGQQVFQQNHPENVLNINHLNKGVYMIEIIMNERSVFKRLIKK